MSWRNALSVSSLYLHVAAPYIAASALVLALIGAATMWRMHMRLRKLSVRKGESLEDTLGELSRRVRELQAFREELEDYLKLAEIRLQKSLRGVGVVRFNPFEGDGSGGNQSFAAAFLDEHGMGVVFSTIHARAGQTNIYAKPIERGASEFELTEEEREAIRRAELTIKSPSRATKKEEE